MLLVCLISLFLTGLAAPDDSNVEILPENCHCRDWYGRCHQNGEQWTDDDSWNYECKSQDGSDAPLTSCISSTPNHEKIPLGKNITINGLWHSCEMNDLRVKYDSEPYCLVDQKIRKVGEEFRDGRFHWLCLSTGRWVTAEFSCCYYSNETQSDVLLKIGETGYNGLIKHVCDRYHDYPGRVQYYAEVRKDSHVKHPTNKGINKNFPEPANITIKDPVARWLHESADTFIASNEIVRTKIRYLPASRRRDTPQINY